MKNTLLLLTSFGLLIATGACSNKHNVVQNPPPPQAPAQTPSAPAQRPTATRQNPVQATNRPATTSTAPAKPTTMPASVRETLNQRLAKLEDALFDYDKSTIRTDATVALRDDVNVIRGILADYPSQKLLIEGHADERGSQEYNLALGDKRARAVEEFLSQMGIPSAQLTVISYGKERPVCTDETEACWQRNRRAHVTAAP